MNGANGIAASRMRAGIFSTKDGSGPFGCEADPGLSEEQPSPFAVEPAAGLKGKLDLTGGRAVASEFEGCIGVFQRQAVADDRPHIDLPARD